MIPMLDSHGPKTDLLPMGLDNSPRESAIIRSGPDADNIRFGHLPVTPLPGLTKNDDLCLELRDHGFQRLEYGFIPHEIRQAADHVHFKGKGLKIGISG